MDLLFWLAAGVVAFVGTYIGVGFVYYRGFEMGKLDGYSQGWNQGYDHGLKVGARTEAK